MIWTILGVLFGSVPGFHPNMAVNLPLSSQELFSLVLGSTFSSVIPALLMVPQGEMGAVLLPGQEAVGRGEMQKAISRFIGGALVGTLLFVITYPVYRHVLLIRGVLRKLIVPFLVFATSATLLKSRHVRKSSLLFFLSGAYGMVILGSGIDTNAVLGAHFTSVFGLAGLLSSSKVPTQEVTKPDVMLDLAPATIGFLGGLFISLFPAITPSQAYAILFIIFGASAKGLSVAGSMSTSAFLLSFQSLKYLGKGRMATVEVVGYLPIGEVLVGSLVAYGLLLLASKRIIGLVNRVEHLQEAMLILVVGVLVVFYRQAMPVALFSLLLGLLPYRMGVERVHLMGSLIIPTLAYYVQ